MKKVNAWVLSEIMFCNFVFRLLKIIEMSDREALLKKTITNLSHLPDEKLQELSDFSEFLISKLADQILLDNIQHHIEISSSYKFLQEDRDIYTVQDLKEKYK